MNWPSPPKESPRIAATVASPMVVTTASRMPGDHQRHGQRQLDPAHPLAPRVAHPLGRLEDVAPAPPRSPATMLRTRISSV